MRMQSMGAKVDASDRRFEVANQTHDGKRIPANWDFFAPPPREIGTVFSGETTLRVGENEMSRRQFGFWIAIIAVLCGSLLCLDELNEGMFAAGFLLSLPFTAFFLTVFATFEHHCSYVGN